MKYIQLFEGFKKRRKEVHTLSGIALVVEGRLLLVLANKYFGQDNKWSIPKGHIEGGSLESALKELEEETGIHLDKNYDQLIDIEYKKGGSIKLMDVFIYHRDFDDIKDYLSSDPDKKWNIDQSNFNPKEIVKAKFYNLEKARKKLDFGMIEIIDKL